MVEPRVFSLLSPVICAGGVYYSDSSSVPRSNLIHTLSMDKAAAHEFRVVTVERINYHYHSDKGATHFVTSEVAALCLTQSRAYVGTSYSAFTLAVGLHTQGGAHLRSLTRYDCGSRCLYVLTF